MKIMGINVSFVHYLSFIERSYSGYFSYGSETRVMLNYSG